MSDEQMRAEFERQFLFDDEIEWDGVQYWPEDGSPVETYRKAGTLTAMLNAYRAGANQAARAQSEEQPCDSQTAESDKQRDLSISSDTQVTAPDDYAGVKMWIGSKEVTKTAAKFVVNREMQSGMTIQFLAQSCLNQLAKSPEPPEE